MFFKLSPSQMLVLLSRRVRSLMKRPYNKKLINLVRLVVKAGGNLNVLTSLSLDQCIKASVLVVPCNDPILVE